FSPDGKSIAYVAQARAGFESDLWALKVRPLDGGPVADISARLDRPVLSFCWKDPAGFLAVIDSKGTEPIVSLMLNPGGSIPPAETIQPVVEGGVNTSISVSRDGRTLAYLNNNTSRPSEVHLCRPGDNAPGAISSFNVKLVKGLDLPRAEDFEFPGA